VRVRTSRHASGVAAYATRQSARVRHARCAERVSCFRARRGGRGAQAAARLERRSTRRGAPEAERARRTSAFAQRVRSVPPPALRVVLSGELQPPCSPYHSAHTPLPTPPPAHPPTFTSIICSCLTTDHGGRRAAAATALRPRQAACAQRRLLRRVPSARRHAMRVKRCARRHARQRFPDHASQMPQDTRAAHARRGACRVPRRFARAMRSVRE